MASPVSVNHIKLITKIRKMYPDLEIEGWPYSEANLGAMAGIAETNLKADILIWFDMHHAVCVEYQSEIHDLKESNDWHDKDDIAGRDLLKKQLLAQLGVGLVEVWFHDFNDFTEQRLKERIEEAASKSYVIQDKRKTKRTTIEGTGIKSTPFPKIEARQIGSVSPDTGPWVKTKANWPPTKMKGSSFK